MDTAADVLGPPDSKKLKLAEDKVDSNGECKAVATESGSRVKESGEAGKKLGTQSTGSIQESQDSCQPNLTGAQREVDVGIIEYVSKLPGFTGVLKQRYLQIEICMSSLLVPYWCVHYAGYFVTCFLPEIGIEVTMVMELVKLGLKTCDNFKTM